MSAIFTFLTKLFILGNNMTITLNIRFDISIFINNIYNVNFYIHRFTREFTRIRINPLRFQHVFFHTKLCILENYVMITPNIRFDTFVFIIRIYNAKFLLHRCTRGNNFFTPIQPLNDGPIGTYHDRCKNIPRVSSTTVQLNPQQHTHE